MKKFIFMVFSLLFLMGSIGTVFAAGPAPYTKEALKKIVYYQKKLSIAPPPGATEKEKIKHVIIDFYSKSYSEAGYSLEKSIIQYAKDDKKEPGFATGSEFYTNSSAFSTAVIVMLINNTRKEDSKLKIYVDSLLSKDAVRALDDILARQQKQEAIKKEEDEKARQASEYAQRAEQEREDARKRAENAEKVKRQKDKELMEKQYINKNMAGHFVNSYADKNSRLDIKFIAEHKVNFTLYITKNNHACKFDNQEALLKKEPGYSSPFSLIYGNESEGRSNPDSCTIIMKFGESSKAVKEIQKPNYYFQLEQRGKCSAYCERGGRIDGMYKKIE